MVGEIEDILQAVIFLLGMFLGYFFIRNLDNRSNGWLALLFGTLAFHFLNLYLLDKIDISHYGMAFGLVYGPCIYFYTKSHISTYSVKSLIHFLPAILLALWIIISKSIHFVTTKQELAILQVLVFVHILVYLIPAFQESINYSRIALQTRSKLEDDKMKLIQYTIIVIGLIFLVALVQSRFYSSGFNVTYHLLMILNSMIIIFGMFGMIYKGMDKPYVFTSLSSEEKVLVRQHKEYTSSGLTIDQANKYLEMLAFFMLEVKPYKEESLTINQLAKATNIPPRSLSQIINQNLNKNFYDYINSFRIQEAQLLLSTSDRRISEIMYEVGFSSRSSFNTAFKKHTNLTPSQFRKKYR